MRIAGNIYLFIAALFLLSVRGGGAQEEPADIHTLPGFKAENIYTAPKEQGSWVSLTVDPKGRLITSDQFGVLYRITVGENGKPPLVEPVRVFVKDEEGKPVGEPIGAAQGLAWIKDSLYVVVNGRGGTESGLYRVQSKGGNDVLDTAEFLSPLPGAGEHGPHGVVLAPDGSSIYVAGGNDCGSLHHPGSRVPSSWGGDQLLSLETQPWDWHSKNGIVPGGWVCQIDLNGKNWEVICGGFRNHYRLTFSPEGELFTADGDDEWQIGQPWYRAPRICHVVSGGDFGWRSGMLMWPAYFPDGVGPVVDLPRGSPSGLLFGTGAKFPAKYQRALFTLDWAYGKVYAVHLKPTGSSYSGTFETFLSGKPLALTDAVIGKDGAMYLVTGGRSIQSHLYRVTYTGDEPTAPVPADGDAAAAESRRIRHELENLHQRKESTTIDTAWAKLDSADPFIRFAARVALENEDVTAWQERVFTEKRTQAALTGSIALARRGDKSLQPRMLATLNAIDWQKLSESQKIELLRAYQLAFIRMGTPDAKVAASIESRLNAFFPAHSDLIDRELSRLLAFLNSPDLVPKALALLSEAKTQEEQIHLGNVMTVTKNAWTQEQRKRYFEWLKTTGRFKGGREVRDLLNDLEKLVLDKAKPEERAELLAILDRHDAADVPSKPMKFVQKWTVDELLPPVQAKWQQGNIANGKQIFHDGQCIKCHYFNGEGTEIGPDLTSVGSRFDIRSIIESIVEPSKVIPDMYATKTLILKDGRKLSGRIRAESNGIYELGTELMAPEKSIDVNRNDVASIKKSPVSDMPEALADMFTADEIADLIAFLIRGADEEAKPDK